jgi:hypothetical protein
MFFNADCNKNVYESIKTDTLNGKGRNYLKFRARSLQLRKRNYQYFSGRLQYKL